MSDKHDNADKQPSGMQVIDAITPIGGPSAAELRQPYSSSKSLDQIAADLRRRRNYDAIEAALRDGHARSDKRVQQRKFASQEK